MIVEFYKKAPVIFLTVDVPCFVRNAVLAYICFRLFRHDIIIPPIKELLLGPFMGIIVKIIHIDKSFLCLIVAHLYPSSLPRQKHSHNPAGSNGHNNVVIWIINILFMITVEAIDALFKEIQYFI